MARTIFYVTMLALLATACKPTSQAGESIPTSEQVASNTFEGNWRSENGRMWMNISKSGDVYIVKADNNDVGNMFRGTFGAPISGGMLQSGTLLGNAVYDSQNDRVLFAGAVFSRE